jgi:hypothetical protein
VAPSATLVASSIAYRHARDQFRLVRFKDRDRPGTGRSDPLERTSLTLHVEEMCRRRRSGRLWWIFDPVEQPDQPVALREGQIAPEHAADDAEHRGVQADANRERQNRGERGGGMTPQNPHRVHRVPPEHVQVFHRRAAD